MLSLTPTLPNLNSIKSEFISLPKTWDTKIQIDRLFLWSIVSFTSGIIIYLKLHFEPSPLLIPTSLLASLICYYIIRHSNWRWLFMYLILPILLGFATMQLRTHMIIDQNLPKIKAINQISGTIDNWDDRGKVSYFNLHVDTVDDKTYTKNFTVRVRSHAKQIPKNIGGLGDRVTLLAKLYTPSAAKVENGFSPQRYYRFKDIAYTGFALSSLELLKPYQVDLTSFASIARHLKYSLNEFRFAIAESIRSSISDEDNANVAVALLTGLRGRLSQERKQDMRYSGLAHLLAISGLHMGFAALSVFFMARLILCLFPHCLLNYSTKKLAAMLALATAFIYMLLAGDSVSVHRAWIMISLFLVAILLDKKILNLRILAISALILLLWRPQQAISPGFQFSFLSVSALIAFFEGRNKEYDLKLSERSLFSVGMFGWVGGVFQFFKVNAFISTIAGLATLPAVSYYFGYVSLWSTVANILAVPLTGLFIIPSGFVSLLLMPLGLHDVPLFLMGWGIELLLFVANFFRHLPAGEFNVQGISSFGFVIFSFGLLWLCLWRGYVRYIGILFICLSLFIWISSVKPLAIIDVGKRHFASVRGDGGYVIYGARRGSYKADVWSMRYGLGDYERLSGVDVRWFGGACDISGCRLGIDYVVGLSFSREMLWRDCLGSDVVVAFYDGGNFDLCRERGIEYYSYGDVRGVGGLVIYDGYVRFAEPYYGRLWQNKI